MAKGISDRGSALVNQTADGVDLNSVWQEVADALALYNEERTTIASLLSYRTVQVADAVPQSSSSDSFEEATEFGVPRAIRPPSDVLKLGYQFKDFDISLRATWRFLREATAEQITAQVVRVLEADNKLINGTVLRRLFSPTVFQNEFGHNCYGLWNGDGMTPPPYLGKTFTSSHTHLLTSQSSVIDSQDVEDLLRHVTEHGYGRVGSQMLILAHPDDVDAATLTAWRAGVEYRTGGPLPKFDFIPSAAMPAWISDETIHGPVPAAEYNGLVVHGSYGGALLLQSMYVPKGYVAVVASGGPGSESNSVGFREHVNPSYAGLRHIAGNGPYPIQDSFFVRSFGVGVRHRGAAAVCQITASASYTAPTIAT
ncbi:hypothetical protein [Mycolicibacterium parafortuitum]|uniref:hypothetical protein n=1 Tax=Mycolicibacterium parafortuitum TaxID=39692 RepID=UPI0009F2BA10|nr:hypothetical protein [Mycolicibacterium parafortuitum]ORB29511.1 hypothetical protein BST38_14855 [Mycolicibacterium parafortuitum]